MKWFLPILALFVLFNGALSMVTTNRIPTTDRISDDVISAETECIFPNRTSYDDFSPLCTSVIKNLMSMASLLLSLGADQKVTCGGAKLLHLAAAAGSKSFVEFFLNKGHFVDVLDVNKCTPLHYAARKGNSDIAKYLVSKGADIDAKTERGKTPLDELGYYLQTYRHFQSMAAFKQEFGDKRFFI